MDLDPQENSEKIMKIKDLADKKVLYLCDLDGSGYYWDYRMIVEIDDASVALINHGGSGSGYIPYSMESVDKEFISAFFSAIFSETGDTHRIHLDYDSTKLFNDFLDHDEDNDDEVIIIPNGLISDYVDIDAMFIDLDI